MYINPTSKSGTEDMATQLITHIGIGIGIIGLFVISTVIILRRLDGLVKPIQGDVNYIKAKLDNTTIVSTVINLGVNENNMPNALRPNELPPPYTEQNQGDNQPSSDCNGCQRCQRSVVLPDQSVVEELC